MFHPTFSFADSAEFEYFRRMFRAQTFRKFFSALVLGVYLFAALFSQNFHRHETAQFSGAKSTFSQSFSKSEFSEAGASCLSCHFLHTHYADVPPTYSQTFISSEFFFSEYAHPFKAVKSSIVDYAFLRGPPADFI